MDVRRHGDIAILYLYAWIDDFAHKGHGSTYIGGRVADLGFQIGRSLHEFIPRTPIDSLSPRTRREMGEKALLAVKEIARTREFSLLTERQEVATTAVLIGVSERDALSFVRELLHELIDEELADPP